MSSLRDEIDSATFTIEDAKLDIQSLKRTIQGLIIGVITVGVISVALSVGHALNSPAVPKTPIAQTLPSTLTADMATLRADIAALSATQDSVRVDVAALRESNEGLTGLVEQRAKDVDQLETAVHRLQVGLPSSK